MAAVASHRAALLHRASPRRCGMSRRVAAFVSSNRRMRFSLHGVILECVPVHLLANFVLQSLAMYTALGLSQVNTGCDSVHDAMFDCVTVHLLENSVF